MWPLIFPALWLFLLPRATQSTGILHLKSFFLFVFFPLNSVGINLIQDGAIFNHFTWFSSRRFFVHTFLPELNSYACSPCKLKCLITTPAILLAIDSHPQMRKIVRWLIRKRHYAATLCQNISIMTKLSCLVYVA